MTTNSPTKPIKSESVIEKKKLNPVIILIFIALGVLLFFLEFGEIFFDSTITFSDKIFFGILLIVIFGLVFAFSQLKKSIKRNIVGWTSAIFTGLILPMLLFSIVILGATSVKVPQTSYTNGTFQDNINKSFSITMSATSNVIQKVVMIFYNLGNSNPTIWIIVIILFIIMAIWSLKYNAERNILQEMDAQEIIDSITEKDYKDLEKYEARLAKRKPHWWNKKK